MHYWGSGWSFLLFVIIIIALIYLLVRFNGSRGNSGVAENSALDLLKRRYVQGEISREEYQQMKKDLEG